MYERYKNEVSLADFLVIIGEAAMGVAATDNYGQEYNKKSYYAKGKYAQKLKDSFKTS